MIVTLWPATCSVPWRAGPELGFAVKVSMPSPVPLDADNVSQSAPLDAAHSHPSGVVTLMVPVPPLPPTDVVDDTTE